MTTPIANAQVYGDFAGLESLKKAARDNDPAAIRQVARQFESLFARMLVKSMRDAIGPDPIFGSDQEQAYQGMYDDQLSIELTRGHGLGLADMLVRQLQRRGAIAGSQGGSGTGSGAAGTTGTTAATRAAGATGTTPAMGSAGTRSVPAMGRPAGSTPMIGSPAARSTPAMGSAAAGGGGGATAAGASSRSASAPPTASRAEQKSFIHEVWTEAKKAAQQLGVAPESLVAQAALETDWGRSVPQDSTGRSSNNLFGVKATEGWGGSSVSAGTSEFTGGTAHATTAQFRAYGSRTESFEDYVSVLKSNPRYAAALNTGSNVQAFAGALQRGGYATDPQYAHKVSAVANDVANTLQDSGAALRTPDASAEPLKLASAEPITVGADSLL